MSRLESALRAPPSGSFLPGVFISSTKEMNLSMNQRIQTEVRVANKLLQQNPSLNRTQAISLAAALMDLSPTENDVDIEVDLIETERPRGD